MKKTFLGMIALSMFTMTSCNTDVADTTTNVTYATLNLVTPLDGKTEPYITEAAYKFFFNISRGQASVSMDGLKVENVNNSFSTDTVPYIQYAVQTNAGYAFANKITNVKGYVNKDPMLPISGFNCEITGMFYWLNTVVPGISNPSLISSDPSMIVMQYSAGNEYSVKTVQPDAFYCGTTKTTVNGAMPYENKEMAYRVKFNKGFKTVDVIIYNAKFSEKAPTLTAVVLKDLNVKYGQGAYSIEGSDIVPFVPEAGALTENKNYPFESFKMTFTNAALTQSIISYKVNLHLNKDGQTIVMPAEGVVSDASYLFKVKTEK